MKRRGLLALGCAQCVTAGWAFWAPAARAQASAPVGDDWTPPARFTRPGLASDEGGLWAMMDREETRLRRSPFMMRDEALKAYLQGVMVKLAGEHAPDVRVYPVRTPFFNASMAPNGMVQIWSGLLLRVENEAQLASVLGHELGHYLHKHLLDRLADAKSRSAFGTFMAMFGIVGLVAQMMALAGSFGFSRDQEREADRIGLNLMRRAGYDPREAAKIWENLHAELASAHSEQTSPMFATHPASAERSATLARLAQSSEGGFVGETEYQRQLAPFQFALLEDEVKRGQYAETLALLDRLMKRWPQRADLPYFRGEARRLRAGTGDLEAAQADFDAAVALGSEPPAVHRSLGYLQQKFERPDAAQTAFARYLELAPDAPDAALIRSYFPENKP
ncbi:MAG TPA: M48 family metallopeptidase [Ideonella sp.]|nr:M48 family metallopeptidase [Ideonella sp.]